MARNTSAAKVDEVISDARAPERADFGKHAALSERTVPISDHELVTHAQQGSEKAFRELLGRFQRPVFSIIYRMVRDREAAEDLAQETFMRVFNNIDRYDPKYKFSSWIFKIATNLAIDWMRHRELAELHNAVQREATPPTLEYQENSDYLLQATEREEELRGESVHFRGKTESETVRDSSPQRSTGTLRQSIEASLLRRVESTIHASLGRMTMPDLLRAVEAPTAAATIAQIISAVPEAGLEGESAWTRALARGAARKQEMIQRAGGVLSSAQVAELLGVTVSAVNQRKNRHHSILAVPLSGGEWGFPARQFTDGVVREGVAEVVRAAPEMNPWVLLSILLDDVAEEGGPTLLDRLDDSAVRADVLHRVGSYGEHIAA
ncbi:MAG TPA: sigma-70 family RNA polymerase sigma factor [Longimicrobium sp.]